MTEAVVRTIGVDPAAIPDKFTLKGQGCALDFPLLKLRSLAIGAAELREFDAMVWTLAKITSQPKQERRQGVAEPIFKVWSSSEEEAAILEPKWQGIVGFDFLKFFKVTFDFPEKKLRLESCR